MESGEARIVILFGGIRNAELRTVSGEAKVGHTVCADAKLGNRIHISRSGRLCFIVKYCDRARVKYRSRGC